MKPILIVTRPDDPLESLAATLVEAGVSAETLVLQPGKAPRLPSGWGGPVFLIDPHGGVVDVGEEIGRLRQALGNEMPLLVCTNRPGGQDQQLLTDCGATLVIEPRRWQLEAVVERVLAEIIRSRQIQPFQFGDLYGATPRMHELYSEIETVAPYTDSVLILGDTGTGKELVAGEVHRSSGRKGRLVAINIASLDRELMASELFGHERGAFTGAMAARKGLLLEAATGTVFLDEIGDLDKQSQVRLLRILEERTVRPVGGNRWQTLEARILLATHRNLEEECALGRFRQDLYERIRGLQIQLPPLRHRRADIPLLAEHFLSQFNRENNVHRSLPEGALDPLFRYDWPGNVRELRNAIRQAAVFASGAEAPIHVGRLRDAVRGRGDNSALNTVQFDPATETWKEVLGRLQRRYFLGALAAADDKVALAAETAAISRTQFYEILKKIQQENS